MEQNYNLFQNRDIETHTPTFLSRRISLLILDFKGGTGGMANNKSSPHKAANFFVCMKNTDCQWNVSCLIQFLSNIWDIK